MAAESDNLNAGRRQDGKEEGQQNSHHARTLLSRASSLVDDCHVRLRIFFSTSSLEKNDEATTRSEGGGFSSLVAAAADEDGLLPSANRRDFALFCSPFWSSGSGIGAGPSQALSCIVYADLCRNGRQHRLHIQ